MGNERMDEWLGLRGRLAQSFSWLGLGGLGLMGSLETALPAARTKVQAP